MLITGSCHCGNIKFELQWPGSITDISVRECSCSFCRKHGGTWTSNPEAVLNATIDDNDKVSRYRQGTGTAEFHVCGRCGVVPFIISNIDNHEYAVVNVNSFEGVDLSSLSRLGADFDGESVEDRLARRQRNWIMNVKINIGKD